MKCPVCHNLFSSDTKNCPICGFDELQQDFITEADAEYWYQNKVLPYRAKWLAASTKLSHSEQRIDEHCEKIIGESVHQNITRPKFENIKPPLVDPPKPQRRIKATVIWCIVIATIVSAISLPSIIENRKKANREAIIEAGIQEVVLSLEQKIESQVDDDIVISYSYKKFNESDSFLMWSFKIKMTLFEEFRKNGENDDALLLKIMNNCRIIDAIVEVENDSFEFGVEADGEYIDISNYDGTVSYGDLSSYETFYYEEYGGDRYLHSFDTEYVMPNNG